MREPLAFDPFPCARCGVRLQWVVAFEDAEPPLRPRSRLAVIEFDSSRPHRCAERRPPPRPRPVREPPDGLALAAAALAGVERAQREASAALAAHLTEVRAVADRAAETLAAADAVLRQLRGRPLPPDPDVRPAPPTRPSRGGIQV